MRALLRRARSAVALAAILVRAAIVSPTASDGSRIFLEVGCCHRIPVLREGSLMATFDAAGATQEKIMAAATRHTRGGARLMRAPLRRARSAVALAVIVSPTASDGSRIFLEVGCCHRIPVLRESRSMATFDAAALAEAHA